MGCPSTIFFLTYVPSSVYLKFENKLQNFTITNGYLYPNTTAEINQAVEAFEER